MWFNRKKKEKEEEPIKIESTPHVHTWKDMPWYMYITYNTGKSTASYQIIEPYICITCGQRNNKILEEVTWSGITADQREEAYKAVREKYKKYLKPRAVVEDMINDILLVKDAHHLEMIEKLRGSPHIGVGTSSNTTHDNYKIMRL